MNHRRDLPTIKRTTEDVMRLGTGAVEIKSGYGLTLEGELKILRVIKELSGIIP
jgi:imidazolonepropionase